LDYRVQQFDKDFHIYLENLMKTSEKPVIVAGDLNVALDDIDVYDPVRMEGTACFTKEERESF
jgi:exodeoxyribonuclease-3